MASEIKTTKDSKAMAADTTTTLAPGAGDDDAGRRKDKDRSSSGGGGGGGAGERSGPPKPGFFTIYKKGQGYWTRVGTAIGAALLGALITWQIYQLVPARLYPRTDTSALPAAQRASTAAAEDANAFRIGLISACVFALVYAFFVWRLMNKPANADFLIATDSEMKKVNWTSKRELIGSTKVVILFMFAIALILFLLDLVFNSLFYWIRVLNIPWWEQVFGL